MISLGQLDLVVCCTVLHPQAHVAALHCICISLLIVLIVYVTLQETVAQLGTIQPPLTAAGPATVVGEYDLTQSLTGAPDNGTAATRGLNTAAMSGVPNNANTTTVQVGTPGGQYS